MDFGVEFEQIMHSSNSLALHFYEEKKRVNYTLNNSICKEISFKKLVLKMERGVRIILISFKKLYGLD